jgi:hypothetical protein
MLKQYRSTRAIPACVTVDVTSCVERSVRMPRVPSAFVVKRSTMADAKMRCPSDGSAGRRVGQRRARQGLQPHIGRAG